MTQWQDISTAPRGKQVVCGHAEKKWIRFGITHPSMGPLWYYSGTSERNQWSQTAGDEPTHWMPLPAPPQQPEGE